MALLPELASYLMAAWRLAQANRRLPLANGELDQALHAVHAELPPRFQGCLLFSNTRVGFRCLDLPDVLFAAQASGLLSGVSPDFTHGELTFTEDAARRLIKRLGEAPASARAFGEKWGQALNIGVSHERGAARSVAS